MEDPRIELKIIRKFHQEMGLGDMGWVDLAQNREGWRALANVAMNRRVPQNEGHFLTR